MKQILLFLIFLSGTCAISANTIPVTPGTIANELSNASDGDILILGAGTYASGINLQDGKVITLQGENRETVIITQEISMGGALTNCGFIFKDLTIDRSSDYFLSGDIGDIRTLEFYNVTVQNVNRCFLRTNNEGNTIDLIKFDGCTIQNCGDNGYRFIWPKHIVKAIEVTNSTFYNYLNGESFFYPNHAVANTNVFSFVFENNTVYKWGKDGSRAICNVRDRYSTDSNYSFRNNIITEPGATQLPNIIVATGGNLIAEKNLVVNYGTYNVSSATTSTIDDHTLESLGLTAIGFADPDNGDFTITSNSPIATASTLGGIIGDPSWLKEVTAPASLTVSTLPEAAGEVSPPGGVYNQGDMVTLTATRHFGYAFKAWKNADTGEQLSTENPYTFTMNDDMHVQAEFETMATYAVDVTIEGSQWGSVTMSPEPTDGKYEAGTIVNIEAQPNKVVNFLNWEDNSTQVSREILVDANKSFTATFDEIPFIVGWDFKDENPKSDRQGDYYSALSNVGLFSVKKADGTSTGWLARPQGAYSPSYPCVHFWADPSEWTTPRAFEASFSTIGYENIQINAMLSGSYHGYSIITLQYSLDGTNYTKLGEVDLSSVWNSSWADLNLTLPPDANGQSKIYVRWIADTVNSAELGNASDVDGTAITNIYVFADKTVVNDETAPTLISTVPTEGATNASANGSIVLTFDEPMKAGTGDATLEGAVLHPSFGSKTVSFPYSKLSYNTAYTFTVPSGALTDLAGNPFTGITLDFSTIDRPQPIAKLFDAVIATDGTGDYLTVQEGIDAVPNNRTSPWLIFVKNGMYNEHVQIPENKPFIHLIGQSEAGVIITDDHLSGEDGNPETPNYGSEGATVVVYGSNCYFENMTFINQFGVDNQTGPQALAMYTNTDKVAFNNCTLRSYQDTFLTGKTTNSQGYLLNCNIEGKVDYIFGDGNFFFDRTTLTCVENGGYIVAPSHGETTQWGYVFSNCTIDGPEGVDFYLGRPWLNAPKAAFFNTISKIDIYPVGWYYKMGAIPAIFADYNTMDENGNALDLSQRIDTYEYDVKDENGNVIETVTGTAKNAFTDEEAAEYTYENVVVGTGSWDPRMMTEVTEAPEISLSDNVLSWDAVPYAMCYVVMRNGQVIGFTTDTSYTDSTESKSAENTKIAGNAYTVQAVNGYGALSAQSNEASESLGLDNVGKEEFKVFPNPVETILNVSGPHNIKTFNVYNVFGKLVIKSSSKLIDVSLLHSGVYLLELTSHSNTRKVVKFIKK
ncbi:pectinesterase family protein [Flavisericum labens]|uniref:pectinesterase family protein n=1 Tax=Flavisericum labens TaxID=3377112 RepID=UPI00387B2BF9